MNTAIEVISPPRNQMSVPRTASSRPRPTIRIPEGGGNTLRPDRTGGGSPFVGWVESTTTTHQHRDRAHQL